MTEIVRALPSREVVWLGLRTDAARVAGQVVEAHRPQRRRVGQAREVRAVVVRLRARVSIGVRCVWTILSGPLLESLTGKR